MELSVNDTPLRMEVDTGAAVFLISKATYWSLGDLPPQLNSTSVYLRRYSGEQLGVLGSLEVGAKYRNREAGLILIVVKGPGPSLPGHYWLSVIRIDWNSLCVHYTTGHLVRNLGSPQNPVLARVGAGEKYTSNTPCRAKLCPMVL